MQAEHVDTKVVGCDTLAMEGIDATRFAEVVARRLRMKLILDQRFLARKDLEPAFVDFHHQGILAPTN